jgi:hypothetical protein
MYQPPKIERIIPAEQFEREAQMAVAPVSSN